MSAALAVTGHGHVLPPSDPYTPSAHVFKAPHEQPLEAALAETQALIERHGYLVVVHPTTLGTPFLHRLHTIRSVLESDRIALLPAALPPLGLAVLVRQLRQLSVCEFSPGVLGAAARLLTHYVYAGAVLNSVAKLDHVPVTLASHAKSWMPGAQFAVLAAPAARLVRLGSGESAGAAQGALPGPRFATQLTIAHGQLHSEWVTGTLAGRWRVGGVTRAELPEDSAGWWGTGKLVEFAAAIADISVLCQLVSSVRRDRCHWCGLELIGDRCAFCAAAVPPVPPAPAALLPGGGSRNPTGPPPGAAHSRTAGHAVVADPRGL